MNRLLVLLSSLFCAAANADDLVIHLGSYHSPATYYTADGEQRYNNVNPGLGYASGDGWIVGAFWNSYKEPTVYAGKQFLWNCGLQNLKCGAVIALGTGYEKYETIAAKYFLQPFGGVVLKYNFTNQYGISTMILPPLGDSSALIHFALTVRIRSL